MLSFGIFPPPPRPAVLVAWRSRRATAIRIAAPLIFLLLALIVNLALDANNALQERFTATPAAAPLEIGGIPSCHEDLYIGSRPCIDFVYTPNNDTFVNVSSTGGGCSCGNSHSSSSSEGVAVWSYTVHG